MSPSKMRKTQAYSDGRLFVDGGPDLRDTHSGEYLEAYNLGVSDMEEEREQETAYHDNPYRLMRNRLKPIMSGESDDVSEVADILDDLLIKLADAEDRN